MVWCGVSVGLGGLGLSGVLCSALQFSAVRCWFFILYLVVVFDSVFRFCFVCSFGSVWRFGAVLVLGSVCGLYFCFWLGFVFSVLFWFLFLIFSCLRVAFAGFSLVFVSFGFLFLVRFCVFGSVLVLLNGSFLFSLCSWLGFVLSVLFIFC